MRGKPVDAPEQKAPEQVTPQAAPEQAAPVRITPEQATSEQVTSPQAAPEQVTPPQATPDAAPDAALTLRLREAEPRLSAWLDIVLENVSVADDLSWQRLRLLLDADANLTEDQLQEIIDFIEFKRRQGDR